MQSHNNWLSSRRQGLSIRDFLEEKCIMESIEENTLILIVDPFLKSNTMVDIWRIARKNWRDCVHRCRSLYSPYTALLRVKDLIYIVNRN